MHAFLPTQTYVCLHPSGGAERLEVTRSFWATVDQREALKEGRLVAAFDCATDWDHWEMHPHGEEVLVMISGRMTLVLEQQGTEQHVVLKTGHACLVPRGVWHRALVQEPGQLLAVTYGRDTQHRNV
jgi:mannose-6-phosphate isomerase-like protein (cupin superfamily)